MNHSRRVLTLLLIGVVVNMLSGCSLVDYAYPKLTLFDDDKVTFNFSHMNQVFRSHDIAVSTNPMNLVKAEKNIHTTYAYQGEQRDFNEFLDRSHTTGLLVLQNNKIVYERYFQGYNRNDHMTSFSVAKSFVATLVGIAVDEGRIHSLEDPITDYVPELKSSGFNQVPIVDILQMSSGIDFSERYDDKSTDAYKIYDEMFLWLRPITEIITDYGSASKPGTRFHYASINTQALGMLVEKVFGKKVHLVLQEKLWQPMGANDSAYWLTDQHENEVNFWGLNATLRDYAKFGLLHLNQGYLNQHRIVSSEWVRRATLPDKNYLQPGQINHDWGYQYHWWIPRESQGDYSAIGIWGQFIYVNPGANVVIVKTSADADFKPHEFEAITAFRSIADHLAKSTMGSQLGSTKEFKQMTKQFP